MADFIGTIADRIAHAQAMMLDEVPWPPQLSILVLAPHPDDFDSVAVTLRFFRDRGDELRLAVLSPSASGVEDSFCRPPTAAAKAEVREREQRASCRLFGLPDELLVFLHLSEDESGNPVDDRQNYLAVRAHVGSVRPGLVFLPHGNDPNPGHRLAFEMLRRIRLESDSRFLAALNRDPKTLAMRSDLYTFFGEQEARWKAELLCCHVSQHQRNLNTRGYGFDERILRVNRQSAAELPGSGAYAEVFELWGVDLPE